MSLLMKLKEESEKTVLKLHIQKTKIMASSPITSWQVDRETVETVTDFILGGSKITADGDCSHEIKTLLGRKTMTHLDSILKIRDMTLLTKAHLVKAMVFPVVMYGYVNVKVTQSCPYLCDPMNYTVHGILQARILEWVAVPFSRGIFPTQGSNPGLPHCKWSLYRMSHKGSPRTRSFRCNPAPAAKPW